MNVAKKLNYHVTQLHQNEPKFTKGFKNYKWKCSYKELAKDKIILNVNLFLLINPPKVYIQYSIS